MSLKNLNYDIMVLNKNDVNLGGYQNPRPLSHVMNNPTARTFI